MAKLGLLARGVVGAIGGAAQANVDIIEREGKAKRDRALVDYKQKFAVELEAIRANNNLQLEKLRQGGLSERAGIKAETEVSKQATASAFKEREVSIKESGETREGEAEDLKLAEEKARLDPSSYFPLSKEDAETGAKQVIDPEAFAKNVLGQRREIARSRGDDVPTPDIPAPIQPATPPDTEPTRLTGRTRSSRPARGPVPKKPTDEKRSAEIKSAIGKPAKRPNGDTLPEGFVPNGMEGELVVRDGKWASP